MKIIPIIFLLLVSGISFSQPYVYYVQSVDSNASASDANAGTNINLPWATWQKAFNTAQAGDTVYFRGGTWTPTTKAFGGTGVTEIDPAGGHGHSGTHTAPIVYSAYQNEVPILDCIDAINGDYGNIGIVIQGGATNIKFKGLKVLHNWQRNATDNCMGISGSEVGNLYFENCEASYNGGPGFWMRTYDTVYMVNCDSHNNYDSLDVTHPGGGGDGFALSARGLATDTFKLTVVTGCRSWRNSDDGFDIGATKQIDFQNNWSWGNGGIYEWNDGVGLKLSYSHLADVSKRRVYNCIFAHNHSSVSGSGMAEVNLYEETIYGPVAQVFNNIMYHNFQGFASSNSTGWANYPSKYYNDDLTNNIVYQITDPDLNPATFKAVNYTWGEPKYVTLATNTFVFYGSYNGSRNNPAYTVTDDDFVSLDTAQLSRERKIDGSLPDITAFKLVEGSDLKGVGTYVGMSATPDLGVDWDYLGAESPDQPSTSTDILTFTLSSQVSSATINSTAHTVAITVAYGTNITSLTPAITVSAGATISPTSGTARNFTSPLTYTVTAEDGTTTQSWSVTVNIGSAPEEPEEPTPTGTKRVRLKAGSKTVHQGTQKRVRI